MVLSTNVINLNKAVERPYLFSQSQKSPTSESKDPDLLTTQFLANATAALKL